MAAVGKCDRTIALWPQNHSRRYHPAHRHRYGPVVYVPWWLISRKNIETIVTQVNKEIIHSYLAPIRRNQQILLGAILIFIVGAAGIAILISDHLMARPILKISSMAADIEAGWFEVHQLSEVAERQDELGQLACVFQLLAFSKPWPSRFMSGSTHCDSKLKNWV